MNVLISVDENYLKYTGEFLYSISKNTKEEVDVYLLNTNIITSKIEKLKRSIEKYHVKIHDIKVDLATNLPQMPEGCCFTIETYYRCFAQFILPDLDRILYLDVDLVVNNNIDQFYHQDFEDNYYVVCQDRQDFKNQLEHYKQSIGISGKIFYFNAGVLLMNLEMLRKETSKTYILNTIIERHDSVKYYDQDLLNFLYHDKVKKEDWHVYNLQCPDDIQYSNEQLTKAAIIHYIGKRKPWNWIALKNNQEYYYWNNRISFRKHENFLRKLMMLVHYIYHFNFKTRKRMKKLKKMYKFMSSFVSIKFKKNFNKNRKIGSENEIVLLNPEIKTDNLGDSVIMKNCREILNEIFPGKKFYEVALHTLPNQKDIDAMNNARAVIVCGTNFLRNEMALFTAWKYKGELRYIPNLVLMGVGTHAYGSFSPDTKLFWRFLLNNGFNHSVRDTYTLEKMQDAGIKNVYNTNCLTLWNGIDKICNFIPENKSNNVIFTLTSYYNDIKHDQELIKILKRNYETLYFWPQGDTDLGYLKNNFDLQNIMILDRSLEAYDKCLENPDIDYVGSRLHGGIHAMYHKKRTIILAVDNRAREIGRDTNIPVIDMNDIGDSLEKRIQTSWKTKVRVNNDAIDRWKNDLWNHFN